MSLEAIEANRGRNMDTSPEPMAVNCKLYSSAFENNSCLDLTFGISYAKKRGSKRFIPSNEKNRSRKQFFKVK